MNFSKTFLDELRSKISLSDIIGERVLWDERKSRYSHGDFWAPCPFHDEKTASFHADNSKGFYYCFGCHAKGDVFSFLKDHDNLSFYEAVKLIAERTGVTLPEPKKNISEIERKNRIQYKIMSQASNFFSSQLVGRTAKHCRDYLQSRGISDSTVNYFEMGYAPNSNDALTKYLESKGFNTVDIIEAGLALKSDRNHSIYDRFRDRLIFPIKDETNRVVAFGGRSIQANAKAKYLNSPETSLFSKGKLIYNFTNARPKGNNVSPLLVVEGYMDVVSMFQVGFKNVVAPLGTALTETQLKLIWKLHNEPTILFDGDTAGQKASEKVLSLSLPYLESEKSLRFGILPKDQDPDDYAKSNGAEGLQNIIASALPIIDMLWHKLTENTIFDSPERVAALELNLNKQVNRIKNSHLRNYFQKAVKDMHRNHFLNVLESKSFRSETSRRNIIRVQSSQKIQPRITTKASALQRETDNLNINLRLKEAAILYGSINHPTVAFEIEDKLSRVAFKFSDLIKIRDILLEELPLKKNISIDTFQDNINKRLFFDAVSFLEKIPHINLYPLIKKDASASDAKKIIVDAITRHNSLRNFLQEIEFVKSEFSAGASEDLTRRITEANESLRDAIKGIEPTSFISDEITRESSELLNLMIKDEIWKKKK